MVVAESPRAAAACAALHPLHLPSAAWRALWYPAPGRAGSAGRGAGGAVIGLARLPDAVGSKEKDGVTNGSWIGPVVCGVYRIWCAIMPDGLYDMRATPEQTKADQSEGERARWKTKSATRPNPRRRATRSTASIPSA